MNLSFPDAMPSLARFALSSTLASLQFEEANPLVAVLIGGSMARGTSTQFSDVDVFLLIRNGLSQRRRLITHDVDIDLFFYAPNTVSTLIDNGTNPVVIENFATGWNAWDPFGKLRDIQSRATVAFGRPRRWVGAARRFALRERSYDILKSIELTMRSNDLISCNYLFAVFVTQSVDSYYQLTRRWDPPPRKRIADLAEAANNVHHCITLILDNRISLLERFEAARQVAFNLHHDTNRKTLCD